jgi:hypothetical protein
VNTGALVASFIPTVGGRLISLRSKDVEYLWQNPQYFDSELRLALPRELWPEADGLMSSWANLGGSKTWPAPQGWSSPAEWPGPPDPVIDGGAWSHEIAESGKTTRLTLRSPDDQRTGLRITRCFEFRLGESSFVEEVRFEAVAGRIVRWAIWEVVQVATTTDSDEIASLNRTSSSGVFVETTGQSIPRNLIPQLPPLAFEAVSPGLVRVPIQSLVGKMGFPNASGSLEYRRDDGNSLKIRFDIDESATYPDGGSRVELWMQYPVGEAIEHLGGLHPQAHLVELEALGPLRTLKPGEISTLRLEWSINGSA